MKKPAGNAVFEQLQKTIATLNDTIQQLLVKLNEKDEELAQLRRLVFGPRSERGRLRIPEIKVDPIADPTQTPAAPDPSAPAKSQDKAPTEDADESGAKKAAAAKAKKEKTQASRQAKRAARAAKLPVIEHTIEVPPEDLLCNQCGGSDFRPFGEGEVSYRIEHVPEHLVRHKIIRRKMVCKCASCNCVRIAPPPESVTDGAIYGPGMHAHAVVSKCADSIPATRAAKMLTRAGAPISKQSINDLFHRCAKLLEPLYKEILKRIIASPYVNADETRLKLMDKVKCREGYIWVFLSGADVAFVFSVSRSGETPRRVLAKTQGFLQVDGYSGYNSVCVPQGRDRVGCWGHARRKFYEALLAHKAANKTEHQWIIDQIQKLYIVEYLALERGVFEGPDHLVLRKIESAKVLEEISAWLKIQSPLHSPKSLMGKAITYAMRNWQALSKFLTDAKIKLDNNRSERELRVIAVGRKNFLFVGSEEAGQNLAILQTIVATCQTNKINPYEYLRDVLIKIQTHPMKDIDSLLPDRWVSPG